MERRDFSEYENEDTVYGGSMDKYEFYQAEFEIKDELPVFVEPDVQGIKATLMGEEIILSRLNTKVFEFNIMETTLYGVPITIEFIGFDHIYVHRGEGKKPYWYVKPEDDEIGQAKWDNLANRLVEIDCDYTYGAPKTIDFEQMYSFRRGDESMDDIIEQIYQAEKRKE